MWTRPWTVIQDFARQPDEPNRIYCEPRCHEGNYGGARAADRDPGRGAGLRRGTGSPPSPPGSHPATRRIASCSSPKGHDPLALR